MLKPIAKITDLKTAKDKKEKGAISAEWQILGFNKFIEKEVFDAFVKLYEKYILNADMVIEIREDNYSNALNFSDAVEKINKYNKQKSV